MKNDHPLVSAMKMRSPKMEEPQRLFELSSQELPNGKNVRPGDPVTVYLYGTVKSVHDDGRIMVNVTRITNEKEGSDEKETKTSKVLKVQTQESHAP